MPISLILACVWAVLACLAAMGPRRIQWPVAWVLIATGIPLLGWVTYQAGPFWGLLVFVAGASILRWPLKRAAHHLRRAMSGAGDGDLPR
ncbi:DUF2484 family protein [Rhodobacteraceae bacterium M385]|nr:DUF2484 family protein [Rhodobacteraceae bacterium M385]